MIIPRVPVQHRRLLPDRRLSGPTPWVIAILMMLTLLAAAAGVGLARSANAIGAAIAGRVTVQIVTANPVTRAEQAAALATHFPTIEMLHLIGATDRQITRLFQRRIAIDTAYGIALGTVVAAAILLLIGWQWSGVTSGLAATASFGPAGWALLLALPLLAIALAALTARQTLLAALKKIL